MVSITRHHVHLGTGTADRDAELIYADGELMVVALLLADWSHGKLRGRWLVKASFGRCSDGGPGSFDSVKGVEEWVRRRLTCNFRAE